MATPFFTAENLKDRSFFMTEENAEQIRNMSDAEFRKHAARELATLRLQLRVVRKAVKAKQKAINKGVPFTLESARDGIRTADQSRKVLAELQQKIEAM
jgi:hypothetical protein